MAWTQHTGNIPSSSREIKIMFIAFLLLVDLKHHRERQRWYNSIDIMRSNLWSQHINRFFAEMRFPVFTNRMKSQWKCSSCRASRCCSAKGTREDIRPFCFFCLFTSDFCSGTLMQLCNSNWLQTLSILQKSIESPLETKPNHLW